MAQYIRATLLLGALSVAQAKTYGYISEVDNYSLLAPCAASAITYNFDRQTYSTNCGDDVAKLQPCICTNSTNLAALTSTVYADLFSSCGEGATEDRNSASTVMDQYCNPNKAATFATPTTNVVNVYPLEIPQITYLPSCAQSGISAAAANVYSICPTAASLWASCACSKSGVVEPLTSLIGKSVRSSCSNGDDATAALNFFSEYCDMGKGKTTFLPPPGPPGDMTYYITGLSQYVSLKDCAKSGVSEAIFTQTNWKCGKGPQALASCVCLKQGMSLSVSSDLTASVKGYCSSTAAADVSSALALFEFYCSAAAKKVVATALESISETRVTGVSQTGSRPSGPGETNGSSPDGSTGGGGGGGGGGLSRGAVIAIAVLASLVGIGIFLAIFFVVRRRHRKAAAETPANDNTAFGDATKPVDGPTPTQSPWSELDSRHESVPHANEMAVAHHGQGTMTPMHEAASSMVARPPPGGNYNDGQGWNFGQGTTHEMDAGTRHPNNA